MASEKQAKPVFVQRHSSGEIVRLILLLGKYMPVNILVVRLATTDEVEFCRRNEETLAREEMGRRF
jgi:hypothetical protein